MSESKNNKRISVFPVVLSYNILIFTLLLILFLILLFIPTNFQTAKAATKTWDSGGANDNCSTAGNWDNDTIPTIADDIVINSTADAIIWDSSCPQTVNSFLMDTGFTGSVQVNTVYGSSGFTVFTITTNLTINAGTMKHADNSTAETYRLNLSVGGDMTIGASGSINVNGLGYDGGYGPGAGATHAYGRGGSYGGVGGVGSNGGGTANTYGSIKAPNNLGSGGFVSGGGAVVINVVGLSIINGTISANGSSSSNSIYSGGSGGSIYITSGTINGTSGSIIAKGGSANVGGTAGEGGGGRISIVLTNGIADFSGYTGSILACTGESSSNYYGGAGTIYKQTALQEAGEGNLIVNNNNHVGEFTIISSLVTDTLVGTITITPNMAGKLKINSGQSLTVLKNDEISTIGSGTSVTNNGMLNFTNNTLDIYGTLILNNMNDDTSIINGDVIVYSGGVITHDANPSVETYKLNLKLNGNLDVRIGGSINANGKGYSTNNGPGNAGMYTGASYGGEGGFWESYNGYTYGSIIAPYSLGSSGNLIGGGCVKVMVSGNAIINGTVSSSGVNGTSSVITGGSGGSVYIITGAIFGSGVIEARGGNSFGTRGSGGGGRIAIILTSGSSFDNIVVNAFGGTVSYVGGAGTIYKQTQSQGAGNGELIIDNNNVSTASGVDTRISTSVTDTTVGTVTLTSSKAGKLTIDSGASLIVQGTGTTLTVGTGTTLTNNGTLNLGGTTFTNNGTITHGSGSTINFTGQADNTSVTIPNWSYQNLGINKSQTTFTANSAIGLAGNLNITSGTFNPNTYTITGSGTNTLNITDTANVTATTFAGSYASFETITLNSQSTINYLRSGDQTIDNTLNYYNLTTSGSGTKTLGGNTTILGNLTHSAGTLAQDAYTFNIAGNISIANGATFTKSSNNSILTLSASGTITDSNTTKQDLGSVLIGGTSITTTLGSGIQTTNLTLNSGNTLSVGSNTLTVSTTLTNSGTITTTGNGSNIIITSSDLGNVNFANNATSLPAKTYSTLTLQNGGTITGNTTAQNLTITSGTLSTNINSLTVSGTLNNNGLIIAGTGQITIPNASSGAFTFTDTNTIPQATYTDLTINASGKTLTLSNNTTAQNLTITSGTLDHTTNHYTLLVDGTFTNNGTILNRPDSYTSECNQTTIDVFPITQTLTGNKAYYIYRQDSPTELNSNYIQSTQWQDTDPHDGATYIIKYRNQDLTETTLASITTPATTCGSRNPTTISSIVNPIVVPETQEPQQEQPQQEQTQPQQPIPTQLTPQQTQTLITELKAKLAELITQLIILLQEKIKSI